MKKDIYNDTTYLANNPTWHEEDSAFKVAHIIKVLHAHAINFRSVCEVGCGSGEILVQMRRRFTEVGTWTGYDISRDAIAIAGRKVEGNLSFKLLDIAEESPDVNYDLMLVMDVLEHLENYFSFLDATASRSRYFMFHIPLDMSLWSLLREGILIESKRRVGHIHNFTEDFIKSILEDHGYTILYQSYTEPMFKVMSTKQKVVNALRSILHSISPRLCSKILGGYSIMLLAEHD